VGITTAVGEIGAAGGVADAVYMTTAHANGNGSAPALEFDQVAVAEYLFSVIDAEHCNQAELIALALGRSLLGLLKVANGTTTPQGSPRALGKSGAGAGQKQYVHEPLSTHAGGVDARRRPR
jgi:hypothetical protein